VDRIYQLEELAEAVNAWCREHDITPASGQAAVAVTERSIRYYRTIGLLDAPAAGGGAGFDEKHFLQLVAVRILQGQGVPLRRIRELLFGRSIEELREIQTRGAAESKSRPKVHLMPGSEELWRTIPLNDDFILISRTGNRIPPATLTQIRSVLEGPEDGSIGGAQPLEKERKTRK
jgi:DNA-binding transcriptional MerR regulator